MNKVKVLQLNNNKENFIYSPYSLLMGLCMLYEGADGVTKEEIKNILVNEKIFKLDNIENVFSICNKLAIDKKSANEVNQEFIDKMMNRYNADLDISELNVDEINKWIETKTFGQIKKLLKEINGDLLLINTTVIDMEWPYEIDGTKVNRGLFDNNIEASYIYGFHQSNLSYFEDDNVLALGIETKKYVDNLNIEIDMLQPKKLELNDYIDSINDDKLVSILSNLKSLQGDERKITVSVPKFSFNYQIDANETLKQLGFTTVKEPNISKLVKTPNNEMDVHHKCNIDFSDKGLKASAATVFEITLGACLDIREVLNININKPFVFVVRETNTNSILFIGTVYNPVLWIDDQHNYKKRDYNEYFKENI